MNPNRQNTRFGGPGCGSRPGGRPMPPQGCNNPCAMPVTNVCCDPCCDPCDSFGTGVIGGIIVGQQGGADCNRETVLQGMPIAMAYVPWQSYDNLYSVPQALQNGTLFRELDLEFAGRRCN